MLRFFIILSIFINISYAQGQRYFIQLGSFKDQRLLERNINSIPESLRSHIVVVRSNSWLIPFAYHTPNRVALQRKLVDYRRYFPDAIISSSSYILNHRVVLNYVRQEPSYRVESPKIVYHQVPRYRPQTYQHPQYIAPEASVVYHPEILSAYPEVYEEEQSIAPQIITTENPIMEDINSLQSINVIEKETLESKIEPTPIIDTLPTIISNDNVTIPTPTEPKNTGDIKRYRYFTSKMLSGRHYYLAYKATDSNPNLLIKVKFGTHTVSYQPIVGDMQMADANYIVDNKRLYMYADSFSENGAYSKIEAHRVDHILVSSWSGGKKLNTLRYYFRIADAKRYLNIEQSSDKLSEAIEEGLDYDWGLDL